MIATKKELIIIIVVILIFGFIIGIKYDFQKGTISFNQNPEIFLISFLIILTSIFFKKIAANYWGIEIEHRALEFSRWGWYERSHLKKPIPMGLILPFFTSLISLGLIKPLTFLQFHSKNIPEKRLLKRRSKRSRRKSEVNESDTAFTATVGFYGLLLLAIIGTIIKSYGLEIGIDLAKYAIYYGAWNLVPVSSLDGIKIFFGSINAWTFLFVFYVIALILVLI